MAQTATGRPATAETLDFSLQVSAYVRFVVVKRVWREFFSPSISVLSYEHHFTSDQYTYLALFCFYHKEFWRAWER